MIDSKIESAHAGRSVTLVGALANGLLILLKFTAGIFGQSQALIADAVHSIAKMVERCLIEEIKRLDRVIVHVDPATGDGITKDSVCP